MIDIYNQHQNMNYAELRKYYADIKKRQKLWYSIPLVMAFVGFFVSYFSMTGTLMAGAGMTWAIGSIWNIFGFIMLGICVPLLPINRTDHLFAAPALMGIFTILALIADESFSPFCLVNTLYLFLAVVMLRPLTEQINFMKGLPNYPFSVRDELRQKEYEDSMRFSETSEETKAIMNQRAESYDGSQTEKLLSSLPKRHLEGPAFSEDVFDEIDTSYTDKLVGEAESKKRRQKSFDEPLDVFNDIVKETDLNADRRDRIDELDTAFKGDYRVAPKYDTELEAEETDDKRI